MGKFGPKMAFLGNFLTNPRDLHRPAVKLHEICWSPSKIFFKTPPLSFPQLLIEKIYSYSNQVNPKTMNHKKTFLMLKQNLYEMLYDTRHSKPSHILAKPKFKSSQSLTKMKSKLNKNLVTQPTLEK